MISSKLFYFWKSTPPPPPSIQYTLFSLLYFMFVLLTSMHHLYPSCITAMRSFFAFLSEKRDKKFKFLFCCFDCSIYLGVCYRVWVGSSVYMGWWQCIQWSTGRLIYSHNQNKQKFNFKIFELFQIVNDQTKEHLLYQWIFKNYKIYCLEPMNVNWWANWLECISFLSHDNEVTVGGVKVQLEQWRDGVSCAWRGSGGFIAGPLFQISFPYVSLCRSL